MRDPRSMYAVAVGSQALPPVRVRWVFLGRPLQRSDKDMPGVHEIHHVPCVMLKVLAIGLQDHMVSPYKLNGAFFA